MTYSAEQIEAIYHQHGGNLDEIAAVLGLEPSSLKDETVMESIAVAMTPPEDLGRESMRNYIISVKHADSPTWPASDEEKINNARAALARGTHTMCTGRDRGWFILYSIPKHSALR